MRFEILVDKAEKVTKCTILPLAYRADFAIVRFERGVPLPPLAGELLLHPEGEPLAPAAPGAALPSCLSAIDCNWKFLTRILAQVGRPWPRLVRIPDGFVTAYPRRNKQNLDPDNGLATIEALFIAAAFLGRWDETLLAEYHWKDAFLDANAARFADFGLGRAERALGADADGAAKIL